MSEAADVKLIDGTARTLKEVFSGRKYGLDYYQREYTWTKANVTELLEDLGSTFLQEFDLKHERKQVASYRPYFLGPIVTSLVDGTRYLVDGQQRLTTLTLLLMHLIHLGEETGAAGNLRSLVFSEQYGEPTFNINVPERERVMRALLDGQTLDVTHESESIRTIHARFEDIVELYPEELAADALPYFSDWLIERVVLVEIGTTDQNMALEIFETMNDRGMRLSNTDMLKGYLLARIADGEAIRRTNEQWRRRITELTDSERNADSDFIKAWLRGKYADTIRERSKNSTPGDFDLIGTAFHKWVRDNSTRMGLTASGRYREIINVDFDRLSSRYLKLLEVSKEFTPGWEEVFYNATNGFTLQSLLIMSAVTPLDDDDTFRRKTKLIAGFVDILIARRMVNFRNFGYSTVMYTMFNLAKDIRNRDLDQLRAVLADRVADLDETFEGVMGYRLTQRNRSHMRYLLARMTAWLEEQTGRTNRFNDYVEVGRKNPYEVEHIWANRFDRHTDEFDTPHAFDEQRNRFGGLLLLPKDLNASYGAKPYSEKLPQYFSQNILAASLHPNAYESNPSFRKLREETGLPFKPYEDSFTRADMEERQELYMRLCELIWDPAEVGLSGGERTSRREKDQRRAFYGVTVADLLTAGVIRAGATLIGSRSGRTHHAVILADGRIRTADGSEYETLTGAADNLTGKTNNGWDFWQLDEVGSKRSLLTLRDEYLRTRVPGSSSVNGQNR